jgi:hypothetical protein
MKDVEETARAVLSKREALNQGANELLHRRFDKVETAIREISRHQHGFLAELGLDLVRAIVVAAALLAMLLLGVGDFVKSIFEKLSR